LQSNRFRTHLITGIILLVILGIALYFRIALPYEKVFVGDWIKYTGSDAFYFMRYVDNFVHNFPQFIQFDPYLRFPQGYEPGNIFFVVVLGSITWLFGLGSPSAHTIDIVGVYFPAVICALSVIPMFFIGKALFNRWIGLMAAGLLAVMPGESMGRTILGYTDRDGLEILLSLIAILFMILMVKSIYEKQDSSQSSTGFSWNILKMPFIYSILSGIFLGMYLLTWRGTFIFVVIFCLFLVIQVIIDYFRNSNSSYICAAGFITLLITLIIFLFASPSSIYIFAMVIAILIPIILGVISIILKKFNLKPLYFILVLLLIAIIGLLIFWLVNSRTFLAMFSALFNTFIPNAASLTIMELQPILFPQGNFTFMVVWLNFTTGIILFIVALILLIRSNIRKNEPIHLFLIIWSVIMLLAMLMVRRFALLFTINVAVMAAYVGWLILELAGFREQKQEMPVQAKAPEEVHLTKKQEKKAHKQKSKPQTGNIALKIITLVFVLLLVFLPNFIIAADTASSVHFAPGDAWYESLTWLKENTPQPFEGSEPYYTAYETPFEYPEDSYGVISWWDYGYRILRTGHRPPNCDPGGGQRVQVANFFTAQDETSANNLIEEMHSKYIVIDDLTALPNKFYAVATYAGKQPQDFFDLYYHKKNRSLEPVSLYFPEYYSSMSTRLYNFDGMQVIPTSTQVVTYSNEIDSAGNPYKEIISLNSFTDYDSALDFLQQQDTVNVRIVGTNPFISPIPLETVKSYDLIYSSKDTFTQVGVGRISTIKIFEYID
jgi:oligosaccharyl transferase (archaeosortase A-associated)